jgi:hypothetical protein
MPDWRAIQIDGLGPLERVVEVFQVGPPLELLPFARFKVKVLERVNGSFLGVLNVAVLGPDGFPLWEAGLGGSVEEALEDALRRFVRNVDERNPQCEADFAWSDPAEF